MAGVTHCMHEHFLPDQITSPILDLHFGQFSLTSFVYIEGSQVGGSMKKELHSVLLPCWGWTNRTVLQFLHRKCYCSLFYILLLLMRVVKEKNQ